MKLRNKQTGEILESARSSAVIKDKFRIYDELNDKYYTYNSLAELNQEWEDVPEEEVWYLGEEIGNYALPKEEARKITKKILAWERLEDKGFRFNAWYGGSKNIDWEITSLENESYIPRQICDDLDLLFGGGE